jgi:hypothetical protein
MIAAKALLGLTPDKVFIVSSIWLWGTVVQISLSVEQKLISSWWEAAIKKVIICSLARVPSVALTHAFERRHDITIRN